MFKSILPSRRVPSSDFTMVTTLNDVSNDKENCPGVPQSATVGRTTKPAPSLGKGHPQQNEKKKRHDPRKPSETNQEFDKLLDELQIPPTLRPKLVGMDATVKAAMLKSSQTLAIRPKTATPATPPTPRRAYSTESLSSPKGSTLATDYDLLAPPNTAAIFGSRVSSHNSPYLSGSPRKTSHSRGLSFDAPRFFSRSQVNLPSSSTMDPQSGKLGRDKSESGKSISPTKFFSILSSTSSTEMDVEDVKKLRLLLRNESATWSQEFLKLGGYSAMLTRLNEILEIEWREEQHDDQVLHELLRCFKALSTSAIGCFALRSSCPTPFVQLVKLLYSDKKPGDVATRQLIVELLLILFELYPPSALPSSGSNYVSGRSRPRREAWENEASVCGSNLVTLPAPHKNFYSLIRALLLTPAPPPSESPSIPVSPHAFIESLHRPRIYKTYLQELSDVCRDYFWVFCHPNNTIWILSETDETKVEKPRAPGGMTGGVEFEAMGYFTTHLRLLNSLSKCVADLGHPRDHEDSAYRFHSDLFLSGLERILLISRKASTTYYPTLHLELARYIAYVSRAGYELPYTVGRLVGLPPPALAKSVVGGRSMSSSSRSTPRLPGSQTPALPSPRRVEPLKFD
ncbi:armadillo-type protein [Cyathus striatus]|nr:armadillo-type protein [Cyathus striatus]